VRANSQAACGRRIVGDRVVSETHGPPPPLCSLCPINHATAPPPKKFEARMTFEAYDRALGLGGVDLARQQAPEVAMLMDQSLMRHRNAYATEQRMLENPVRPGPRGGCARAFETTHPPTHPACPTCLL
jgi:hypothetical protein